MKFFGLQLLMNSCSLFSEALWAMYMYVQVFCDTETPSKSCRRSLLVHVTDIKARRRSVACYNFRVDAIFVHKRVLAPNKIFS